MSSTPVVVDPLVPESKGIPRFLRRCWMIICPTNRCYVDRDDFFTRFLRVATQLMGDRFRRVLSWDRLCGT